MWQRPGRSASLALCRQVGENGRSMRWPRPTSVAVCNHPRAPVAFAQRRAHGASCPRWNPCPTWAATARRIRLNGGTLLRRWSRAFGVDESVDTPGSVTAGRYRPAGDGHPSTTAVTDCLQRSTHALGRAALERALSELAPGGVYLAGPVTWPAGGLLHHRFTLTAVPVRPEPGGPPWRSVLCGTVPRVTPGGR